jgi:hypothetical protein
MIVLTGHDVSFEAIDAQRAAEEALLATKDAAAAKIASAAVAAVKGGGGQHRAPTAPPAAAAAAQQAAAAMLAARKAQQVQQAAALWAQQAQQQQAQQQQARQQYLQQQQQQQAQQEQQAGHERFDGPVGTLGGRPPGTAANGGGRAYSGGLGMGGTLGQEGGAAKERAQRDWGMGGDRAGQGGVPAEIPMPLPFLPPGILMGGGDRGLGPGMPMQQQQQRKGGGAEPGRPLAASLAAGMDIDVQQQQPQRRQQQYVEGGRHGGPPDMRGRDGHGAPLPSPHMMAGGRGRGDFDPGFDPRRGPPPFFKGGREEGGPPMHEGGGPPFFERGPQPQQHHFRGVPCACHAPAPSTCALAVSVCVLSCDVAPSHRIGIAPSSSLPHPFRPLPRSLRLHFHGRSPPPDVRARLQSGVISRQLDPVRGPPWTAGGPSPPGARPEISRAATARAHAPPSAGPTCAAGAWESSRMAWERSRMRACVCVGPSAPVAQCAAYMRVAAVGRRGALVLHGT